MKNHNIECQNHKTVHLESQTGWTSLDLPQNQNCIDQFLEVLQYFAL